MSYYRDPKNAYNEQSCRDEYISPLLECFGWDVHNKKGSLPQYREVVVEQYSNNSERPDYTLTLNGVSKIFVEAKKPSIDITVEYEPAMQSRRYGWNAKHKITVLTNFENLMIYDTTNMPNDKDSANTSLYKKYHYTDYISKYKEICDLISRNNVYSGKYDEFVDSNFQDKNRYYTEIDSTFLAQINNWRLDLGKSLYSIDKRYRNLNVLNDVVQTFINQILFIRICEDRNLPLYESLKETANDKSELKKSLEKVFKEVDKRYNSGLFNGNYIIFDLDNDIIFDIIMSLYYPQTPYLFKIIEPSILGKIYESLLSERLSLSGNQIILSPKKEYIYKSVVSTPQEIVKYMVKNTLEKICEDKSPKEILRLRIADIACGSGIFLEESFQYLIDYCTQWYEIKKPNYLLDMSNGRRKLPLEYKKEILVNCIYGVDIDVHAVEVSKLSLLLKLIEDETEPSVNDSKPILPDLSNNIFHGNSLVSREDIFDWEITTDELMTIIPFNWTDINNGENFDVIIGNPPYVKTEDIHALSSDLEFQIYKRKYKSAYKQFDKYFIFLEKALNLLKENGVTCYIVPNKFYKIDAGKELRKIVGSKIIELDDFGDLQLFPDKTIYSSIITMKKNKSNNMKYRKIASLASIWSGEKLEEIDISNDKLKCDPWKLTTDISFMKLINQMELNSVPLVDVVDVFNGIQTSAERPEPVYWFCDDDIISEREESYLINKFDKTHLIEKGILKPYFKPTKKEEKGMHTYSLLKTDKLIIFPYDNEGKLYTIDTMKTQYPGTYKYFTDCYDKLVPKCLNHGKGRDIKDATPDTWYKYGRTQALTAFINKPKLIVRVLSKEPMYAFDKKDMLIASGGTAGYCAISELQGSNYSLEYIQAWLTHPYTEKMLQIMGSDFENGFTARGTYLLKKIPFALLDFEVDAQRSVYESVIADTRRIYKINEEMCNKSDKASHNVLEKEKMRLIKSIEANITKVYHQKY